MIKNAFEKVRTDDGISSKYQIAIKRENPVYPLYERREDIRSPFARDYTRILHSFGFRRLRHKTQVFFAPNNDHICTRLEHALHVASIATTICKQLGLNDELANAIALGHDLGHAPFGHYGEYVLDDIWREYIENLPRKNKGDACNYFWHEKHSLRVVDKIETVKDCEGYQQNLNLTYAVRDGIICHCGEVEFKPIFPRADFIRLEEITCRAKYQPYTWEGCIVKVSDVISYLGRDIEDAEMSEIINDSDLDELKKTVNQSSDLQLKDMSNSVVIHELIRDLCKESAPQKGIKFSRDGLELHNKVRDFDNEKIYRDDEIETYKKYIDLMLTTIFKELKKEYDTDFVKCIKKMKQKDEMVYQEFVKWLERYHKGFNGVYKEYIYSEKAIKRVGKIYDIKNEREFLIAIMDYMAGFTDNYAIRCFNDIVSII